MAARDLAADPGPGSGPGDETPGSVRWRRFALVAGPSIAVAAAVLALTAQGAVAASFAIAGQNAKISADRLEGSGFVQFGTLDRSVDGKVRPVLVSGFRNATLTNLCQSVVVPSPLGSVSVKLTAGGGGTPVKATDLVVDLDHLSGNIEFNDYASGVDASRLTGGPTTGTAGMWGQQASKITITGLRQTSWATTAGSFSLNGLALSTATGTDECF